MCRILGIPEGAVLCYGDLNWIRTNYLLKGGIRSTWNRFCAPVQKCAASAPLSGALERLGYGHRHARPTFKTVFQAAEPESCCSG